jgi:K+-transporting ATPase KdpF subunit
LIAYGQEAQQHRETEPWRHAGRCLFGHWNIVLPADGSLCRRLRPTAGRIEMIEPLIGLVVAALLGVYLLYTLIYPEKF